MNTEFYRKHSLLRIFISYFKPHRRLFLTDVFCALLVSAIDLAYPLVSGGEIGKAFPFTTDATGLIGILHDRDSTRMNYETTIVTGLTLFAERLDGVVVGTIGA